MLYICGMKKYYLKNYNRFVNLVWLTVIVMFGVQFSARLPVYQASLVALCIFLASFPLTTYLSTTLLRKSMQRKTMFYFSMQFLLCSFLVTLLLLCTFRLFTYLESIQLFPPSVIFNGEDTVLDDLVGSMVAALFINLAFCGLRFYEENLKLQKILVDSQLQILQLQINPHFMFNVLNHIHVLMQKDVDMASELLLNYSEILRYQLYGGKKETVDVNDEIVFLKKYIEVEKVRWQGKVDVAMEWNIMDGKQQISPLLLTPFVENAFKHVERTFSCKGYVYIDFRQTGKEIEFVVENSKSATPKERKEDSGIGLDNIRQRLSILYPERFELNISDEDNSYRTELIIHL